MTDAPPEGVYRADVGKPDQTVGGPDVTFTVPVGAMNVTYSNGTLAYIPRPRSEMRHRKPARGEKSPSDEIDELLGLSGLYEGIMGEPERPTKKRRQHKTTKKSRSQGLVGFGRIEL